MKPLAIVTAIIFGASASVALAQDGPSAEQKARQGMMRIIALNIGVLGGMAKGEIAFDADKAGTAANTLVAVSTIDQGLLWPDGSFNDASMLTIALPVIAEKRADFAAGWTGFGEAAKGLQTAAAEGQAALGPAMGKAGNACKNCHENFREKQN